MPPYVLGASLLFVIMMGLLLRFCFWMARWSRSRREQKIAKAANSMAAETVTKSALQPSEAPAIPKPAVTSPQVAAPAPVATLAPAPASKRAAERVADVSSPVPAVTAKSAATEAADVVKSVVPSVLATLAVGETFKPRPSQSAPTWARQPLPENVAAATIASTLQPAGAKWTPPAVAPAEASAPSGRPTPVLSPSAPLGPLVIDRPSVGGTLPNANGHADTVNACDAQVPSAAVKAWIAPLTTNSAGDEPPPGLPARSLSAGASTHAATFRIASARPAPTPRPGPAPWSIVALKTSLPFRVRRPETRLVGKTAKEVLLISKARQATRVLGQSLTTRIASVGPRSPFIH
ncbi:MAG: hypothetical protein ACKVP4_08960 [Hyphomicrobium sp.]